MKLKEKILPIAVTLVNGSTFWVAIITDYFVVKGIPLETGLLLISMYQILNIIFEYPTGVIGDKIGHKYSVILGGISLIIGFIILILAEANIFLFGLSLVLGALGFSFISGSDISLIASNVKDIKSTNSFYSQSGLIMQIIIIISGTVFYSFNPDLPFILTIITTLIGVVTVLFFSKNIKTKDESSPLNFTKNVFKEFISKKELLLIVLSAGLLVSTFGPIKWIIGPMLGDMNIASEYWGLLFALLFLGRFVGAKISKKVSMKLTFLFAVSVFVFLFLSVIFFKSPFNYAFLVVFSIAYGVVETNFGYYLLKIVNPNYKSSIISIRSMFSRLVSSILIFLFTIPILSDTSQGGLLVLSISAFLMVTLFSIFYFRHRVSID